MPGGHSFYTRSCVHMYEMLVLTAEEFPALEELQQYGTMHGRVFCQSQKVGLRGNAASAAILIFGLHFSQGARCRHFVPFQQRGFGGVPYLVLVLVTPCVCLLVLACTGERFSEYVFAESPPGCWDISWRHIIQRDYSVLAYMSGSSTECALSPPTLHGKGEGDKLLFRHVLRCLRSRMLYLPSGPLVGLLN